MHVGPTLPEGVQAQPTLQDVLARMAAMDSSIHARIDTLANDIGVHVTNLEARINARIDDMEARIDARFQEVNDRQDATNSQVAAQFQEVKNRQDVTNTQVTVLVNKLFVSEHNFRAKHHNATTIRYNHRGPLVALVSHSTGIEIPSFPKDLASLYRLTPMELCEILHALEIPTAGLEPLDLQEVLRQEMM